MDKAVNWFAVGMAGLAIVLSVPAVGLAAEAHNHSGDVATDTHQATEEADEPADVGSSGRKCRMMQGEGMTCPMMKPGADRSHGHAGGPAAPIVVINIYPGGAVSVDDERGGGMIGHRQMRMTHGGGEGMMDRGGQDMMRGSMMRHRGHGAGQPAAPDAAPMSAKEARGKMTEYLSGQGAAGMGVGEIAEIDADLLSAWVVDQSGAPVHRYVIDRRSGEMMRVQ